MQQAPDQQEGLATPQSEMSQSLRSLISGLRSALSSQGSGPGGRLSLQISTAPERPPPGADATAAGGGPAAGAAAGTAPSQADTLLPLLTANESAGSGLMASPRAGAGDTTVAGADNGLAAAAEHHRLTSLSSTVDLRAVSLALERSLPYVTLLLFLFIAAHVVGMAVFAYLTFVLFRLNLLLRAQVALKQDRQARQLAAAAGIAAAHVPLVLVALRRHGQDVAGNLLLAGQHPPTQFWSVVFEVVVGDTLLRFLAVVAKVAVLLWVPADSAARFRRRGHVLTAVEYVWAVYRMLPPAPLWYNYFAQTGVISILRTGLSGAYLLVKAQHVMERAALAALALRQVAVRGYGSAPSADEVQEAGNSCPICQDAFRDPVRLSCGHIFCSDCCGEWFERERTCPMCRAAVGPANKKFKSHSDGKTPLFPVLF